MGPLKVEMLQDGRFINAADAHAKIFSYIDDYYNTQRLHSSLNYQSPNHFENEIALANSITFTPNIGGISIERIYLVLAFHGFCLDELIEITIYGCAFLVYELRIHIWTR